MSKKPTKGRRERPTAKVINFQRRAEPIRRKRWAAWRAEDAAFEAKPNVRLHEKRAVMAKCIPILVEGGDAQAAETVAKLRALLALYGAAA